jgi:cobalt/nickel transport system permease protein
MHIPDGYLSPQTCVAAYAVAVPTLAVASRKVSAQLPARRVPTLAMFSAVSFLVMMFNVPVPDGTSAHAVGAVIIAIVLGPWAAVIAIAVALLLQALLFGDGGVLAYGANVVNLAIVMPFVGIAVYRLIAGDSPLDSRRRLVAAGVAGYCGINVAALVAAVMFGLQPVLFQSADGAPLYSPYPMSMTIPAMALAHLVIAGPVEAILTVAVFRYLVASNPESLRATHSGLLGADGTAADRGDRRGSRLTPGKVAVGSVAVLALASPLGLLAQGTAFGESAPEELPLTELGVGAIPEGMRRYAEFWSHALLGDYGFGDGANPVVAYWVSALVGIVTVGVVVFAVMTLASWLRRTGGRRPATTRQADPADA